MAMTAIMAMALTITDLLFLLMAVVAILIMVVVVALLSLVALAVEALDLEILEVLEILEDLEALLLVDQVPCQDQEIMVLEVHLVVILAWEALVQETLVQETMVEVALLILTLVLEALVQEAKVLEARLMVTLVSEAQETLVLEALEGLVLEAIPIAEPLKITLAPLKYLSYPVLTTLVYSYQIHITISSFFALLLIDILNPYWQMQPQHYQFQQLFLQVNHLKKLLVHTLVLD
jgi:hypothetical protein